MVYFGNAYIMGIAGQICEYIMKLLNHLMLILLMLTASAYSQTISRSVISSLGQFYDNQFEIVQWTVGEAVIETFYDDSYYYLTQGFQQPGVETTKYQYSHNDIDFFPNPVTEYLLIIFNYPLLKEYKIKVYSIIGVFINQINIVDAFEGYKLSVDFSGFVQGIYLIYIYSPEGHLLKTGRIIKI